METVWIFTGPKALFPSGVFTSRESAERWIQQHGLSGTLTAYPVNVGAYDWAVDNGRFAPKGAEQRSPEFIQRFSSASQEHYHYENGRRS
jgi:hypothetical protein